MSKLISCLEVAVRLTIAVWTVGFVFGFALFGQGRTEGPAIATDRDISGVWDFATTTPRERPARFATRPFLTREEAAAFEGEILRAGTQPFGSGTALDDGVWSERGHTAIVNGRYISSLVSDPADVRIPALTQAAKARVADRAAALARSDGPEDRTLSERCLRSASGPLSFRVPMRTSSRSFRTAITSRF